MAKTRNPFEHHHDHGEHDHDQDHHDHDRGDKVALDPAQQSLADALRVTFGLLKLIMAVLVVLYLGSGIIWGVPEQQVAIRLFFGGIVGQGDAALLRPGKVYFALPYPVEQVVYIPTASQQIDIRKVFWFDIPKDKTEAEFEGAAGPLNPEKDGSLITGDANIIHAQFAVQYQIARPVDFIRNIATPSADERKVLRSAQNLVQSVAEESIIRCVAQITADDAARGKLPVDPIKNDMQATLDRLKSGIVVAAVNNPKASFPVSTKDAFRAVASAASEKAQMIDRSHQEANRTLSEIAGSAYEPLRKLIDRFEHARSANDPAELAKVNQRLDWVFNHLQAPQWAGVQGPLGDELWGELFKIDEAQARGDAAAAETARARLTRLVEQSDIPANQRGMAPVAGSVSQVINDARAYQSQVVAKLQAEALAFNPRAIDPNIASEGLLDQYRLNPSVFVNRRWQDMVEEVLQSKGVEVFYLPKGQTYLEINRDQELKRLKEQEQYQKQQEEARKASSGGK